MTIGCKGSGVFTGLLIKLDGCTLVPVIAGRVITKNTPGKDDNFADLAALFDYGINTVFVLVAPSEHIPLLSCLDRAHHILGNHLIKAFLQLEHGGAIDTGTFFKYKRGTAKFFIHILTKGIPVGGQHIKQGWDFRVHGKAGFLTLFRHFLFLIGPHRLLSGKLRHGSFKHCLLGNSDIEILARSNTAFKCYNISSLNFIG